MISEAYETYSVEIRIAINTEPNIFVFGIPAIKVIAPIVKHSHRTIECENVLGCI